MTKLFVWKPTLNRPAGSARSEAAVERPEGREGMVTVYDHHDRYLGCMGREMWEAALAKGRKK